MTITFNIRSFSDMGGGKTVEVSVENMSAQASEMGFAQGLVAAVEKFANEHGKENGK